MNKDKITSPYLVFYLGEEKFAINVENVQEVVELEQVTKIPNVPPYMLGIINLRGRVVPLLDTRSKLGLTKTEITKKSRVLIIDLQSENDKIIEVGALVDVAKEVIEISDSEIQKAPEMESGKASQAITGIVNENGSIIMIIDIHQVFVLQEILQIK